MERPVPDGYIDLRFREPIDPGQYDFDERGNRFNQLNNLELRIHFKEMRDWNWSDANFIVRWIDNNSRTVYMAHNILWFDVHYNSKEYLDELHKYQEQHDHNWVPMMEHNFFGQHVESETREVCDVSKTGEEGCGAQRNEGVLVYG